MIVTFCGHREVYDSIVVENWLYSVTKKLILQGARLFYLGGYGKFDGLCKKVLIGQKKKYNDIKLILIVPYLKYNIPLTGYDESICPEIEHTPPKYAIIKRNKWMVDSSNVVVTYVKDSYGGAYNTLKYARQKNKCHIYFFDEE